MHGQFGLLSRENQQTKGINSARTIDITRTTGTQQHRPRSPMITPPGMRLIRVRKLHQGDILQESEQP